MINYGLRACEIRALIMEQVEKKPDLQYYIDNDYIYELVDAIVDGVSIAIEENTRKVISNVRSELRRHR